MEGMIDITGADLVQVVQAAYTLSRPQGLGQLHYQSGELSDDDAKTLVSDDENIPVSLDYVKGRACKLTVWRKDGKLFIRDRWFDHTPADLEALVARVRPGQAAA